MELPYNKPNIYSNFKALIWRRNPIVLLPPSAKNLQKRCSNRLWLIAAGAPENCVMDYRTIYGSNSRPIEPGYCTATILATGGTPWLCQVPCGNQPGRCRNVSLTSKISLTFVTGLCIIVMSKSFDNGMVCIRVSSYHWQRCNDNLVNLTYHICKQKKSLPEEFVWCKSNSKNCVGANELPTSLVNQRHGLQNKQVSVPEGTNILQQNVREVEKTSLTRKIVTSHCSIEGWRHWRRWSGARKTN